MTRHVEGRTPAGLFDLSSKVALAGGEAVDLAAPSCSAYAAGGADAVIASRNHDACASLTRDVEALGRKAPAGSRRQGH